MFEWPSSWQELMHFSSQDMQCFQESLCDSNQPDHEEAWEWLESVFCDQGEVFQEAIEVVPFLYNVLPRADVNTQARVMDNLCFIAQDVEFCRAWIREKVRTSGLSYDPEALLQVLREGFDALRDQLCPEWATEFFTLGVLINRVPLEDDSFVEQFPAAKTEFFAANVLYQNMNAGTLDQWMQRFLSHAQKKYLHMAFIYPYLQEEVPADDLMALLEHGETVFENQRGLFTRDLLYSAGESLKHTLLSCFDPLQLLRQVQVQHERHLSSFEEDLLFAVYQRALWEPHPEWPGMTFNDRGVLYEAFRLLHHRTGMNEFQLDPVELHLPTEVWHLLIHHPDESCDLLETLGIFHPSQELQEKMKSVAEA